MRLSRILLPLVTFAFLCAGCTQIQTANIANTVNRLSNTHDAYVNADKSLTPGAATLYLNDTTFLRSEMSKTTVPASEIQTALTNVADRTDVYVNADITLPAYKKSADLRDTALLREVLKSGTATATTTP